ERGDAPGVPALRLRGGARRRRAVQLQLRAHASLAAGVPGGAAADVPLRVAPGEVPLGQHGRGVRPLPDPGRPAGERPGPARGDGAGARGAVRGILAIAPALTGGMRPGSVKTTDDPKKALKALLAQEALPFDAAAQDAARAMAKAPETAAREAVEALPEPLALAVLEATVKAKRIELAAALQE